MKKLTIIKVGGKIIEDTTLLKNFITKFTKIKGPKILVHGGGVLATELLKKLDIPVQFHNGRRITKKDDLQIITMVYAGWINKFIVAQLQKEHCNAIGLSGVDGNLIESVKRSPEPIDFGFVGDPITVNTNLLQNLLANNLIPVICPLTHDKNGQLLNTNADTIASVISISLAEENLVSLKYCFEFDGILKDRDNANSTINTLNNSSFESLMLQKKITSGMIPKITNAIKAAQYCEEVSICGIQNLISLENATIIENE